MSTNPLTSYFSGLTGTSTSSTTSSTTNSTTSAQISARVEQMLAKQNTVAPKINAQLTVDQTKLSALGQLQSALAAFQSVAQSVSGSGLNAAASSTATSVLTAAGSSGAKAGSYAVNVTQLASSEVLDTAVQASASAALGKGGASTIKIDFGTTGTNSFSGSGKSISVSINSTNNSLNGIAAAINSANAGVTAAVVKTDKGYSLSLTSATGAASSMRVSVTGDSTLQSLLNYDPAGSKKMTASASAKDAILSVDGVSQTSASNSVTAAGGATLTLKGVGASTVTVTRDNTQIAANVSNLVTAYNTLNDKLTSLKNGDLKTTNAVRNIQSQLMAAFPFGSSDSSGSGVTLSSLGITRQGNGDLVLDKTKLQSAVSANPDAVSKFFTNGSTGVADKLATQVGSITGKSGSVSQAVSAVNSDIAALTAKKSQVEQAMTAKGNALMKFYTDQANGNSSTSSLLSGISGSSGTGNLFDML